MQLSQRTATGFQNTALERVYLSLSVFVSCIVSIYLLFQFIVFSFIYRNLSLIDQSTFLVANTHLNTLQACIILFDYMSVLSISILFLISAIASIHSILKWKSGSSKIKIRNQLLGKMLVKNLFVIHFPIQILNQVVFVGFYTAVHLYRSRLF